MSSDWSYLLLPNAPVQVLTVVGKFERCVEADGYTPAAGHTVRLEGQEAFHVNLLKSCSDSVSSHMVSRRRFVEVGINGQVLNPKSQAFRLWPETCSLRSYARACNVISNCVCFVDDSIERLANNYMDWKHSCDKTVEEGAGPAAVVVFCGTRLGPAVDWLAHEFDAACKNSSKGKRTPATGTRCFSRTTLLCAQKPMRRRRGKRNWQLLQQIEEHISPTAGEGTQWSQRRWTERRVQRVCSSALLFFSRPGNEGRAFSVARALSVEAPTNDSVLTQQQSFFRHQGLQLQQGVVTDAATMLLGRYMAHHLLASNRHLELEDFGSRSASLFSAIYRHRYISIVGQLLGGKDEIHDASVTASTREHMLGAVREYLSTEHNVTRSHLQSLGAYCEFYKLQRLGRLCAGCLFASWDDVLPCHHGFCKACTHNYRPQWKASSRLEMASCPACLRQFARPFQIRVQPPTARGRVLSLDGGGAKGAIELEILHELTSCVGGGLAVDSLFDMVVGTSIGGIIALGLSVNQWTVGECRHKLNTLASQMFPRRRRSAGSWMTNMARYARYFAHVALGTSLVSEVDVQSMHQQEFGACGSLLFLENRDQTPIKVAVTACSTRDSACSIITSYNRPWQHRPVPYRWLQASDEHLQTQVWEAARCTSAVPFLFPAVRIGGDSYQDGALAYNNPTLLAIEEAKLFWGAGHAHNLVLSIGCGITRVRNNERTGPVFSCTYSFLESLSAARQNKELLLRGYHYTRLDPPLDMDAVSLDDFEAIPRLQRCFASMLLHDATFPATLRTAAFELLASLFYVELESWTLRSQSGDYAVTVTVRPRIPRAQLQHLFSHATFHSLYLLVNGKRFKFNMPTRLGLRIKTLDAELNIAISSHDYCANISGSPTSAVELVRVQEQFYSRDGYRKRRMQRPTRDLPRKYPRGP